jgi:hypothetical protein
MNAPALVLMMADITTGARHVVAVDIAGLHRRSQRYPALWGMSSRSDASRPPPQEERSGVKGQLDFPLGGQLISLLADSLCPCPRSVDLLLI